MSAGLYLGIYYIDVYRAYWTCIIKGVMFLVLFVNLSVPLKWAELHWTFTMFTRGEFVPSNNRLHFGDDPEYESYMKGAYSRTSCDIS